MSMRTQIEDPAGVKDARTMAILRTMKSIIDDITGRSPKSLPIKMLGADATLAGVINKVNEIVNRLQK